MLIGDNIGENLNIDETMLQEDLVTILSDKDGHCKKGSVISIVRGTKAEDVIEVLMQIPEEARLAVKEVTMDLSNSMRAIVSTVFPNATIVLDCFHVLKRCHDVIEELDPDGVMDFAGCDLKKNLLLMGKGNCAFAEWLNSPIIYYKDEEFFKSISCLKEAYFRKVSAVNHYYHMAMNHDKRYLEKRGCEMKRFMYHLRGLLAAKFTAIYDMYPPVLFNELVEKMVSDKSIKAEIADLVRLKQESREHNTMIVSDFLVAFAAELAAEIEAMLGTFPGENPPDLKRLDEFFLNILNTFDIQTYERGLT